MSGDFRVIKLIPSDRILDILGEFRKFEFIIVYQKAMADTNESASRRYNPDGAKQNAQLIFRVMGKDDYSLLELREALETKKGEFSDDDIRTLISHSYEMRVGGPLCGRLGSCTVALYCITDLHPISLQDSCNEDELAKYGPEERTTIYYQRNRLKNLWFYHEYFDLEGLDAERIRDLLVNKFPDKAGCIRIAGEGLGPKFAAKLD
jgi:hypothetical protein